MFEQILTSVGCVLSFYVTAQIGHPCNNLHVP